MARIGLLSSPARDPDLVSDVLIMAIRRCPLMIQLQLSGLFFAIVMSAWISLVAANPATQVHDLELPAATEVVWDERVRQFGERIEVAFGVDAKTARRYAEWTLDAAARHRIQPELLASLVYVESTFDVDALSPRGAIGPAQVMPGVWSSVCRGDLRDPADNIDCGARILAAYVDDCGAVSCALVSYNAGPSALARGSRIADRYVARVDRHVGRRERAIH